MSIDFIELLDSHIMATENVIIEEERIKDEYNIHFNDAQIKSHLTNLVYDGKKVSKFFDLLDQRTPQRTPYTNHIMPIISCKKHIYYIKDDDYEPDQDFEEEQQIIMNNFDDFIIQFDAMNHDTRNKYSMTKERLDNLMRPFLTTGTPNHTISKSVDGMDGINRRYRMVPNDQVKLIGFYTGSPTEDRQEIHIAKYLKNLRKLRDNDDVRVMFNDFAFRNNKLVIKAKATVRDDRVVFDKPVYLQTPDVMTSSLPINDDRIFVFPTGKPPFSKYAILTGNYAVYGEDHVKLSEFILPSSVTQALFIEYRSGAIKTYRDLSAYVLEEEHRHVIDWVMRPKITQRAHSSKRARVTSNPQSTQPPPHDRHRAAFLTKFKEYLASLQQQFDKDSLSKQINKIRGELESLKDANNTCAKVVARPIKIVKTFSSVTELNADLDAFRENEYVILQQPLFARDELFVMKSVQGNNQWVKVRNLDKCDADILIANHDNITQDLCMYDSAEQACQYLENIWVLRKKQAKERHLQILEDISWLLEHDSWADDINALIAFFEMINKHDIMRNIPFDATFHGHYEKIVADEDLYGEDLPMTFEELMNFTEGNEMPRPLQQQKLVSNPSNPTELDNVTIISKYLDINFTSDHLSFMKQYVSRRFDKTLLDEQLVAERTRLMAPINQTMYQSNRDYKNKVDGKIEERLRAFMEKKYEKFYYDEIVFSAALIQCMILALYPTAEMSKIVPRCSALYSSTGHPIASDATKNIESYLACALKQMAIEDDIRYKLVISSDRVVNDIKSSIDAILIEDYSLSQRIANNKQTKSSPRRITRMMEAPLNVSFRPAFNFPVHTNDDAILFLKTLNDVVARSKYNKINMKKSAFISNFCCPELLTNEYDTYDMFTSEVRDMNTVRQKTAIINHSRTTFPPLHAQHLKDPFEEPTVTHHKWMKLTHDEARDIVIDPIEDDEFNKVIYPRLNANFEKLSTLLLKILDKPNIAAVYFIRDALINNMNNDPKLHRMVLHNFLVNKLSLQVSKWINGIANETDELDKTVRSNTDVRELLKGSWPFVKVFADTIVVSGAEDACIKDIIMLLDSLFAFLTHLSVTAGENMRTPNVKLVHTLIDTMITKMHEYYQNNIFDNQDVLKNIEELRELKKQSMMDAYAVDDEERTIQIQLRNIGVTNWQNIFDRMKNVDLTDMNAQREENENYRMGDYAGENDEADEINEDVY
jgi:hypothetical protein